LPQVRVGVPINGTEGSVKLYAGVEGTPGGNYSGYVGWRRELLKEEILD
jgi:hypothetical protein